VTKYIDLARSRAWRLVESNLRQELNDRAALHTEHLGAFHFAESAAQALETSVSGNESALREWLLGSDESVDLQTLRLFHAVLENGRLEYASAARTMQKAELVLEDSRNALFQGLKQRSKLREIRKRRVADGLRHEANRQASETDEFWLQNRGRQS